MIATLFSGPNSGRIRPEDRPNVAVDERMNALIVSGNESSFGIITNLIDHLDKEGVAVSGQIRIVPLKHATAQSLSAALMTLFNQRYQNARSPEVQRKRPVIIADPRSNSLLVAAGADDNRALDDLLEKLDRKPENNAVAITVLGLRHSDAARVAPVITGIFDAHRRSTTPAGQPVAPQDQVFVQADPVNNALIVSASAENLELMKGLLEKLDVEPVAVEGLIQTFTLKQADAQRAATMLRSLIDQGVYRPGAIAGGGRYDRLVELYGGPPLWLSRLKAQYRLKPGRSERPLISRPALHSEQLILRPPGADESARMEAPWPKDLAVSIKYLRRYAGRAAAPA